MNGGYWLGGAALCDDIARAAFAATALRGNTQFKLNFVKAHARMRVACNFTVRNPVANTNNHGDRLKAAGC